MSEVHDDPIREATTVAVALAKEIANIVMAIQGLQFRLVGLKPDKDAPIHAPEAPEPELAPEVRSQQAVARLAWQPALNDDWLTKADPVQATRAWAAALPHVEQDPSASLAVLRAEARLSELHPQAMSEYHRLRAQGLDAPDAMLAAAPTFDTPTRSAHLQAGPAAAPAAPGRIQHMTLDQDLGLDVDLDVGDPAKVDLAKAQEVEAPRRVLFDFEGAPAVSAGADPMATRGLIEAADVPELGTVLSHGPGGPAPHRAAGPDPHAHHFPDDGDLLPPLDADVDLAAGAALDAEPVLTLDAGQPSVQAANLHADPNALPVTEAERAAEIALRNFPNAAEAVDRVPVARASASRPRLRKALGKRLRKR